MKEVRFGIVGIGSMGGAHLQYFHSLEKGRLTALCDIDAAKAQQFGQKHGVPFYTDHKAMLDSGKIDAVLIATPHYDHPKIALDAMERGIHVLCEKPEAVTVGAARKLNEAYNKKYKHLKFGLMFQQRTSALYQKMRELIAAGELGEITRVTWLITDWFRTWTYYASGGWRATWEGEGGGVLLNQCPHNLDLIQWIAGMMPNRVTAVASIGKTHPIEVEDEVSAILEYPNGAIGHFVTTTGEAPGTNRLEICGDQGKLVSEGGKLKFFRTRQNMRELREKSPERFPRIETWEIDVPNKGDHSTHQPVTQNFIRAVLEDVPLIAPGVEGVRGLELGNAMLMSGITRQAVDLPMDADAYEQLLKDLAVKYGGKKTLETRESGTSADMASSYKGS